MKSSETETSKRFLLRFVISYSMVLIFFLIMSFYIYYTAVDKTRENVYQQNIYLLENGVEEMDNTFRLIDTLATQIYSSNDIRKLLYMNARDTEFYLQAEAAIEYLHEIMSLENTLPIKAYYIYLPLTDKLLSSNYFTDPLLYYNHEKRFDLDAYDEWYEMLTTADNFRKMISLDIYKKDTTYYWYKLPISSYFANRDPLGYICMEFNISDFRNVFNNLPFTEGSALLVTDDEDSSLYALTGGSESEYDPASIIKECSETLISGKVGATEINSDEYNIIFCQSAYNSYNYYFIQPSSYMMEDFYHYRTIYIVIIFMTFGLTLITVFLISKKNVKPIIQINNQLRSSQLENSTLISTLNQQKPYVVNSYLARILRGTFTSEEELTDVSNYLNIPDCPCAFSVLCVNACPIEGGSKKDQDEDSYSEELPFDGQMMLVPDCKEALYRCFYRYFGDDICIYLQDINTFALLFHYSLDIDYEEFSADIQKKFILIHDEMLENNSILIHGGLGKKNKRITYVWQSYQQATEALAYVHGDHIFQIHCEIQKKNNSYYYPSELADQLIRFIHAGNSRQTSEIFKIMKRENYEYRSLPVSIIKWLLSDIRNTLVKFRFTIEADNHNEIILSQADLNFQQIESMELLEKTALLLCSLYEQKNEGNKLIASIQAYVNENYADSSLGLSKISETFGISESYFSYLFKAETMQNFSDYLERLRMEQAMLLIRADEIPLLDIYMLVGYNNPNSFRRAFKKVHGASPKTFRNSGE